jgi:hypothetical protein
MYSNCLQLALQADFSLVYSDMYRCEDENARVLLRSKIKKTASITGKNI